MWVLQRMRRVRVRMRVIPRRIPRVVQDGREPLPPEEKLVGQAEPPLRPGKELLLGMESALAAGKAPFPDEKGRPFDEKPPERRWVGIPVPFPLKEGVGGDGARARGEHLM